jgi:hypothetical protein
MKFLFESQRMAHPIVSLIPSAIWEYFFQSEISDDEISLIQADLTALGAHVDQMTSFDSEAKKEKVWLAIAIGHPHLSDDALIAFANQLVLSPACQLKLFAAFGKESLVRRAVEASLNRVESIQANAYQAIGFAVANGHLAIVQYLIEVLRDAAPSEIQNALEMSHYFLFKEAAMNHHLAVMQYLIGELTAISPTKVQEMIASRDFDGEYAIFRGAVEDSFETGNQDILNYLLQFGPVFIYAETHDDKYGLVCLHPFVTKQLQLLQAMKATFEQDNPGSLFNIEDEEQTRLCFYMLRNLIRRNDIALQADLLFLINIPSVKALLHTAVTPEQPNELYRLALENHNEAAIEMLEREPLVYALAVQANFYRPEAEETLDLLALGADNESSLLALTEGEQQRLASAEAYYGDSLRTPAQIEGVMQRLRETLKTRYEAHPAQIIKSDGIRVDLPMSWPALQALNLNANDKALALRAYYEHSDHTAWRYLEKPNPWMSESAEYVQRSGIEGWAMFEGYQDLIALFF